MRERERERDRDRERERGRKREREGGQEDRRQLPPGAQDYLLAIFWNARDVKNVAT